MNLQDSRAMAYEVSLADCECTFFSFGPKLGQFSNLCSGHEEIARRLREASIEERDRCVAKARSHNHNVSSVNSYGELDGMRPCGCGRDIAVQILKG